jgi:hypothetical protein
VRVLEAEESVKRKRRFEHQGRVPGTGTKDSIPQIAGRTMGLPTHRDKFGAVGRALETPCQSIVQLGCQLNTHVGQLEEERFAEVNLDKSARMQPRPMLLVAVRVKVFDHLGGPTKKMEGIIISSNVLAGAVGLKVQWQVLEHQVGQFGQERLGKALGEFMVHGRWVRRRINRFAVGWENGNGTGTPHRCFKAPGFP